jgi:hypothetical protein
LGWSEFVEWIGHMAVYWLNFWRLAFAYVLSKAWFLVSLAGFIPLLRAALRHEAQGQVQLCDPSRVARGAERGYQPYEPGRLPRRLRRR